MIRQGDHQKDEITLVVPRAPGTAHRNVSKARSRREEGRMGQRGGLGEACRVGGCGKEGGTAQDVSAGRGCWLATEPNREGINSISPCNLEADPPRSSLRFQRFPCRGGWREGLPHSVKELGFFSC